MVTFLGLFLAGSKHDMLQAFLFFLLDSQTGILLAVIVLLNYVVNIKSGNEAARKQQIFMLLCEIKQ